MTTNSEEMDLLKSLKIHEIIFLKNDTVVLKVPNGFIYKFYNSDGDLLKAVFVPYGQKG
jgi:hypothetical protein